MLNRINPRKLLNSKWTAVSPVNREKHFLVTDIEFDEDGAVTLCVIEAVLSKRARTVQWRDLKDTKLWKQGWK